MVTGSNNRLKKCNETPSIVYTTVMLQELTSNNSRPKAGR